MSDALDRARKFQVEPDGEIVGFTGLLRDELCNELNQLTTEGRERLQMLKLGALLIGTPDNGRDIDWDKDFQKFCEYVNDAVSGTQT